MGTLRDRCLDVGAHGDKVVLVDATGSMRKSTLAAAVNAGAAALVQRGIVPGDRVAWLGPTAADTVVGLLAVQAAGAIAVPLSPRHTTVELQHVIDDSDSTLLVAHATMLDRLAACAGTRALVDSSVITRAAPRSLAPVEVDDEQPALLVYTSGTTGRSKGVAVPWRALVSNMSALGPAWGLGPHDTCCLMLPLFHVHGLCIGIYAMLLAGATIHLHAKFEPTALVEDFRDRGATLFLGVPTMYVGLLEHLARAPDDAEPLRHARLFTAGSAPLSAATHAAFAAATGHSVLERYGMTETLLTLSNPLVGARRPGWVGTPLPGVGVRVVDDHGVAVAPGELGELQVRGDSLMTGYWRNPEATAAAFDGEWFRTGDVVMRDETGYYRIVGRTSSDIIKSGGFKISTREIEDTLREHPTVVDAAVVGVADPRWGERVVAVVSVRGDGSLADLVAAAGAHCRERLADYKRPRQWILVDAIPTNAMGKVEKAALRATVERDYDGDADMRRTQNK